MEKSAVEPCLWLRGRDGDGGLLGAGTGWCTDFGETKFVQQHTENPITLRTNRKTQHPMRCWD